MGVGTNDGIFYSRSRAIRMVVKKNIQFVNSTQYKVHVMRVVAFQVDRKIGRTNELQCCPVLYCTTKKSTQIGSRIVYRRTNKTMINYEKSFSVSITWNVFREKTVNKRIILKISCLLPNTVPQY